MKKLILLGTCLIAIMTISAVKTVNAESRGDGAINYKDSLETIADRFVKLTKAGGLIIEPKLPEEYYHNARIYEIGGDFLNARKCYESYINFNLDFIDPLNDYFDIIVNQEGKDKAAAIVNDIKYNHKNASIQTASALILTNLEKIQSLEFVINMYPDYGPAYYELSKSYSHENLGSQSIANKIKEKHYLGKLSELMKSGNLYKYYLDKKLATIAQKDVERRIAMANETPDRVKLKHKFTFENNTMDLWADEPVLKMSLSYDGKEYNEIINDSKFQHFGRFNIDFTQIVSNKGVYIKYTDINNTTVGPIHIDITVCDICSEIKKYISLFEQGMNKIYEKSNFKMTYRRVKGDAIYQILENTKFSEQECCKEITKKYY